ncbi:nuclear GTP-binding protein nug1 [Thecaphora frezii]
MGRTRKEDRQSRKRTKLGLDQTKAATQKSSNASFAPPVFAKSQFTSLANKGKARRQQQQHGHQQQNGSDTPTEQVDMLDLDESRVSNASLNRHGIQSVDHADIDILDSASASAAADPAFQSAWDEFGAKARLDDTITGRRDSSIKAYMKELRKLVENADVLLQVLDARDPMGCRSLETERMLMRAGKKVVLILNKIDLVPKSNVEAWLRYLRHDFPTLAFKASTQTQRSNLSQGAASVHSGGSSSKDVISGGAEAIGAGALLQLIKNYSRNLNLKTSITVGIFGAPNVGKSSLINSLKRARVCSVASTPGHTKVVQGVMLDKSVRLLDCPGIVFSDETGGAASSGLSAEEVVMRKQSALLRNVVKVELVEDPISPVEAIMARVDDVELASVYGLDYFQSGDAQDFLMRIALQRGRMLRGGKIDLDGTARSVLHDWNVGRIKYFTQPPALHRSAILSSASASKGAPSADAAVSGGANAKDEAERTRQQLAETTKIVSGFSEAFDLAGLLGEADAEIFGHKSEAAAPVPEPPKARFATQEELATANGEGEAEGGAAAEEEIVDDHEEAAAGDVSNVSTLGKRRRAFDDEGGDDDDSDSESEDGSENDEAAWRRRPVRRRDALTNVPGLSQMDDDDDQDNQATGTGTAAVAATSGFMFASRVAASDDGPAWLQRQEARAATVNGRLKRHEELSTLFSSQELEGLAASRGAQNRKMKKMKKKAERAGAGLVGAIEAGMRLGHPSANSAGERKGEVSEKGENKRNEVRSGRFAALMQVEDGEEEEEGMEEAESVAAKVVFENEEEMGSGAVLTSAGETVGQEQRAAIEEDEEEL